MKLGQLARLLVVKSHWKQLVVFSCLSWVGGCMAIGETSEDSKLEQVGGLENLGFVNGVHSVNAPLSKEEELRINEDMEKVTQKFESMLPDGWQIEAVRVTQPPSGWNGHGNGFSIKIFNEELLFRRNEAYETLREQSPSMKKASLTRHVYKYLRAGFSINMHQRMHPAEYIGGGGFGVIVKPSLASEQSDFHVPAEIMELVKKVIPTSKEAVDEVSLSLIAQSMDLLKNQHKNRIAVIARSKKSSHSQELDVRTF